MDFVKASAASTGSAASDQAALNEWIAARATLVPKRTILKKAHLKKGLRKDGTPEPEEKGRRLSVVRRKSVIETVERKKSRLQFTRDVVGSVHEMHSHRNYDRSCIEVSHLSDNDEYEDIVRREAAARAEAYRKRKADADLKVLHDDAATIITNFMRKVSKVAPNGTGTGSSGSAPPRRMRRRPSKIKMKQFRRSVHEGDLILEGYLEKRSSGVRKQWLHRFFALSGHYLKYYESDLKNQVKAVIDLYQMESCATVLDESSQVLHHSVTTFTPFSITPITTFTPFSITPITTFTSFSITPIIPIIIPITPFSSSVTCSAQFVPWFHSATIPTGCICEQRTRRTNRNGSHFSRLLRPGRVIMANHSLRCRLVQGKELGTKQMGRRRAQEQ
jgi:hypothetical protein